MSDKYFGAHEFQARDDEVVISSERSFGLVFAGFFTLVAAFSFFSGHDRWPIWLSVAAVFVALAFVAPKLLAPLNRLWAKFGLLLHMIISPLILALLFYVCIMPIGFLMRLCGNDPLRRRFEPDAKSYWIERTPPGPTSDSFKNQF